MTKFIRFWTFIALILILTALDIHAESVYTTGLNLKRTGNKINLEWKANTNKGTFLIYRSQEFPIGNPLTMSNAFKLNTVQLEGVPAKELFLFTSVTDTVSQEGKYYYLVLPEKAKITDDDFSPNLNYNISPVTFKSEEPVAQIDEEGPLLIEEADGSAAEQPEVTGTGDKIMVKSLFIKTNLGVFQVFWDLDSASGANYKFSLYRTTNRIISSHELQKIKPVKELKNEYFYEDTEVKYGVPYFYTIIVNDYKMILSGENQNKNPVFWGNTNAADIRVERDVYRKVKVNTKSFNKRFK